MAELTNSRNGRVVRGEVKDGEWSLQTSEMYMGARFLREKNKTDKYLVS